MKNEKVWETKNPKKKSTPLTSAQKTAAKSAAKNAGRPYPNLIDNMNAAKNKQWHLKHGSVPRERIKRVVLTKKDASPTKRPILEVT